MNKLAFTQASYAIFDAVNALVVDDLVAFGLDVGHSRLH
jgi:hypothetical protein